MSHFHTSTHEAMKTTFTLRLECKDAALATDVGRACIELLDDIERKLSRYVEGSDVWKINHLQADESLFLSETCYDCLRLALDVHQQTGGLFDITLGRQIEHYKNKDEGPTPSIEGQLIVDPDRPAIHCREPGREIDLGGIGKGFALDCMRAEALDWGIESGLFSAGASTQLAFGPIAWQIDLKGDHATQSIDLQEQALSASGTGIQGSHIISPRTGPQSPYKRIWLLAENAATADGHSTAAMLMDREELTDFAKETVALYLEDGKKIRRLPAP